MLNHDLLPAPPVIRERLARAHREARLLRALLRLSCRAVAERIDHRNIFGVDPVSRHEADGRGVANG